MKQYCWWILSVFSFCLGISYSCATLAQGNGSPGNETPPRPVLQLGNEGSAVSQLQAVLKLLGYYRGEVTGTYDESTQSAVSRFQEAAGLTVDGIFGQPSWNRLLPFEPETITSDKTTPTSTTSTPVVAIPTPATPSLAADLPILRLGMTGDVVKRLQSRLQDLGYFNGTIDGIFGEQTLAAVKAAQAELDLVVDGIVGQSTWEALRR